MARDNIWTNQDGLNVGFGTRTITKNAGAKVAKGGAREEVVVEVDLALLGDTVAATDDAIIQGVVIPADSVLESATLNVDVAAAGASAVLDIGIYQEDGTVIADDGIDAAVATATLTAGAVVSCDGASLGTTITQACKVGLSYDTAAFTAGTATLVVEYIPKRV